MTKESARCALLTGASQGLGRAFAEECAGRGMDLVLVAPQEAPRTIAAFCRSGGFLVDTLINNAGIGFTSRFSQSCAEQNEVTIQLNVGSLVRLIQIGVGRSGERLSEIRALAATISAGERSGVCYP